MLRADCIALVVWGGGGNIGLSEVGGGPSVGLVLSPVRADERGAVEEHRIRVACATPFPSSRGQSGGGTAGGFFF